MEGAILTFLAISAVVIITPGQDTALTVRNTIAGGRQVGIATAFGVASGQMVWALATAVGVVTILTASETIFTAIKLLGAAYLVFLGLQALHGIYCSKRIRPREQKRAKIPLIANRLPSGPVQQSRQSEDGGFLRQPPAPVHLARPFGFWRHGPAWPRLLLDDLCLARGLCRNHYKSRSYTPPAKGRAHP